MKTRKGRAIAFSTAALGLVVLVGVAIALKDRLREEWCIYRLKSGDVHARLSAIKELEEKRSVRAVPSLIAMLYKEDFQPLGERNNVSMDGRAAVALIRIGQPAVPLLTEAMHAPGVTSNLLSHAVNIFQEISGREVINGLKVLAEYPRAEVRQAAAEALKMIQGNQDEAQR